nr:hypothetical protein [Hippocampus erectus astro-like virus 1]
MNTAVERRIRSSLRDKREEGTFVEDNRPEDLGNTLIYEDEEGSVFYAVRVLRTIGDNVRVFRVGEKMEPIKPAPTWAVEWEKKTRGRNLVVIDDRRFPTPIPKPPPFKTWALLALALLILFAGCVMGQEGVPEQAERDCVAPPWLHIATDFDSGCRIERKNKDPWTIEGPYDFPEICNGDGICLLDIHGYLTREVGKSIACELVPMAGCEPVRTANILVRWATNNTLYNTLQRTIDVTKYLMEVHTTVTQIVGFDPTSVIIVFYWVAVALHYLRLDDTEACARYLTRAAWTVATRRPALFMLSHGATTRYTQIQSIFFGFLLRWDATFAFVAILMSSAMYLGIMTVADLRVSVDGHEVDAGPYARVKTMTLTIMTHFAAMMLTYAAVVLELTMTQMIVAAVFFKIATVVLMDETNRKEYILSKKGNDYNVRVLRPRSVPSAIFHYTPQGARSYRVSPFSSCFTTQTVDCSGRGFACRGKLITIRHVLDHDTCSVTWNGLTVPGVKWACFGVPISGQQAMWADIPSNMAGLKSLTRGEPKKGYAGTYCNASTIEVSYVDIKDGLICGVGDTNPGDSGSPICTPAGHVIGIHFGKGLMSLGMVLPPPPPEWEPVPKTIDPFKAERQKVQEFNAAVNALSVDKATKEVLKRDELAKLTNFINGGPKYEATDLDPYRLPSQQVRDQAMKILADKEGEIIATLSKLNNRVMSLETNYSEQKKKGKNKKKLTNFRVRRPVGHKMFSEEEYDDFIAKGLSRRDIAHLADKRYTEWLNEDVASDDDEIEVGFFPREDYQEQCWSWLSQLKTQKALEEAIDNVSTTSQENKALRDRVRNNQEESDKAIELLKIKLNEADQSLLETVQKHEADRRQIIAENNRLANLVIQQANALQRVADSVARLQKGYVFINQAKLEITTTDSHDSDQTIITRIVDFEELHVDELIKAIEVEKYDSSETAILKNLDGITTHANVRIIPDDTEGGDPIEMENANVLLTSMELDQVCEEITTTKTKQRNPDGTRRVETNTEKVVLYEGHLKDTMVYREEAGKCRHCGEPTPDFKTHIAKNKECKIALTVVCDGCGSKTTSLMGHLKHMMSVGDKNCVEHYKENPGSNAELLQKTFGEGFFQE